MKNNKSSLAAAIIAVAFIVQLRAADEPSRPTAQSVLPKVEDLGPEWYWPWNIPRQYTFAAADTNDTGNTMTEASWRSQFNRNPRGPLMMQAYQLESMTDDEFKESMAGLAALFGAIADTNSPIGMTLSGGGAMSNMLGQAQAVLTRTQMVAELRATYTAIQDWAANDYNRAKPNGQTSEIPGYVPTDDDNLTLELTVYTDDYVKTRKIVFDLSEESLKKSVEELRKTKEMVQKARDNQLEEYAQYYESRMRSVDNAANTLKSYREYGYSADIITNAEKYLEDQKKAVAEIEKEMNRITTHRAKVEGAMLQGVDGGYLISQLDTDVERQSALIMGKLRRGPVVVEFSRSADGVYAADAANDTLRVLNMLSERLKPLASQSAASGKIQMNSAKSLNYDYQPATDKIPAKLKEKTAATNSPTTSP